MHASGRGFDNTRVSVHRLVHQGDADGSEQGGEVQEDGGGQEDVESRVQRVVHVQTAAHQSRHGQHQPLRHGALQWAQG